MAFGFLKKVVAVLTGKSASKQGDKKSGGRKGRGGSERTRGRHSRQQKGNGNQGQKNGAQQAKGSRPSAKHQGGGAPSGERRNNERRGERRGGERGRRGPAPVNTPSGEKRPGGGISARIRAVCTRTAARRMVRGVIWRFFSPC